MFLQIEKRNGMKIQLRRDSKRGLQVQMLAALGALLSVSLLLGACEATIPTEASPTPRVAEQNPTKQYGAFESKECWFDVPENLSIECGYIAVPEDHFSPNENTLRLAVVILHDQSEGHQPDPVVLLAGGPGERVAANAYELSQVIAPLHPNRDLVIFDQRGVGLSEPALECPEFLDALLDNLDQADNDQVVKQQFESLMACRDRYVTEGINLSAYNTRQSAADVEVLRVALGYEQINLYGASYGSQLAQAVMRDYPGHIRSVAMNSVLPTEKSIFLDTSFTASNAILDLLNACKEDQACVASYPRLQQELFDVVEALNLNPIPMTLTNPLSGEQYEALLTGDSVVGNLFTFLYISRIIPVLPQAIHNVYEGDYSLMQQLSSTRLALLDELSRGTMLSVLCRDDLIGRTPQDQLDIRASLPDPLVSDIADQDLIEYGAFGLCDHWPVKQDEPWVKAPVLSNIPTLLLAGEFDPITPPSYAQLVAENLENATIIELPGMGHDVLSSPCAQSIAGAFIENPIEPLATACVSDMREIAFDLPSGEIELVLIPFKDEARGFRGLVPEGWQELAPANLARKQTALDPAYFVLEGTSGTQSELLNDLFTQLGLDQLQVPELETQLGAFIWTFFTFDRGEAVVDIALTEQDGKAYFVLLISPLDEYEELYNGLFLPAVEAMAPLD
jgi:pimeloyl-ACP methyl ester carboxylesterase